VGWLRKKKGRGKKAHTITPKEFLRREILRRGAKEN